MATGANNMDEENLSEQYARNFGTKEFLRFGCMFMALLTTGLAFGIAFKNAGVIIIFTVFLWGILWLAPYWQPAYSLVHRAMGNKDIPATLPKYRRRWWHYIPIVIKVAILLAALRIGLQVLFQ
jgi:hypothetical protein